MLVMLGSVVQACEAWSAADLAVRLVEAERALLQLDIPGFVATTDELRGSLACVEDVMSADLVARVHRLEGFRRFGDREPDASLAFAAARAAEPHWEVPEELAPAGSPVREAFYARDPEADRTVGLPAAKRATLWVDGYPVDERPLDRPALVQLTEDGAVRWTAYRDPGDPLPTYGLKRAAKRRDRR